MKTLHPVFLILLLFFFFTATVNAQLKDSIATGHTNDQGKQGIFEEKDPTGNISYSYTYKNDKKHGVCKTAELNVVIEENYSNGILQGWSRKLEDNKVRELKQYDNGQLIHVILLGNKGIITAEYEMKDGKNHGEYRQYALKTGELIELSYYNQGMLNGPSISYYKNGDIRSTSTYKDGKLEGMVTNYDKNGKINSQYKYRNGEETDQIFSAW